MCLEIAHNANSIPMSLPLSPGVVIIGGPFLEMTEKMTTGLKSEFKLCFPKLG